MATALAPEIAFAAPRTRFEIDVEALIAEVPAGVTSKGMFFTRVLAMAGDLDEAPLLDAAGLDDRRFVPFGDYPWPAFIRLATAVADRLRPDARAIGLREIGRTLYADFADSLVARMTFGALANNADRVIGLGPKVWNMAGVPGCVEGVSVGDRHYHYRFLAQPADLSETLAVGILEGTLHVCGEVASLGFARLDAMNSVIEIRW
jgi:uncharacterized protein (TIGR02265 family)